MTRINVVPVRELTVKHLVAEYRELPRMFAYAAAAAKRDDWKHRQPKNYVLGKGHMLFFYDKLTWLSERHQRLVKEMQRRGYKPKFTKSLKSQWRKSIPLSMWKNWRPTKAARELNRQRISDRLERK